MRILLLYFLIGVSFFHISCGSKAELFSSGYILRSDINTLNYCINDDSVTLSWTLGKIPIENRFHDAVLAVYLSEDPISGSCCPNCPINFVCVAEVSIYDISVWVGQNIIISYTNEIVHGNSYSYKLKLLPEDASFEVESDIVSFEYF